MRYDYLLTGAIQFFQFNQYKLLLLKYSHRKESTSY